MAISQSVPVSFKSELMTATHNFSSHTFKLALYQSTASLDYTTSAYTATGEASGAGYTAGGSDLTVTGPTISGTVAYIDFNDLVFSPVTITARGAMIYNSSASDKACFILDFGSDKTTSAGGSMTIQFPTADATSAIFRLTD